jgi:hypothetical protein
VCKGQRDHHVSAAGIAVECQETLGKKFKRTIQRLLFYHTLVVVDKEDYVPQQVFRNHRGVDA